MTDKNAKPANRHTVCAAWYFDTVKRAQKKTESHFWNSVNRSDFLGKSGAGDGIRTHDPNLGKVVLYP